MSWRELCLAGSGDVGSRRLQEDMRFQPYRGKLQIGGKLQSILWGFDGFPFHL